MDKCKCALKFGEVISDLELIQSLIVAANSNSKISPGATTEYLSGLYSIERLKHLETWIPRIHYKIEQLKTDCDIDVSETVQAIKEAEKAIDPSDLTSTRTLKPLNETAITLTRTFIVCKP